MLVCFSPVIGLLPNSKGSALRSHERHGHLGNKKASSEPVNSQALIANWSHRARTGTEIFIASRLKFTKETARRAGLLDKLHMHSPPLPIPYGES